MVTVIGWQNMVRMLQNSSERRKGVKRAARCLLRELPKPAAYATAAEVDTIDAAQVRELINKGFSWKQIGVQLGFVQIGRYRFTPEEDAIICEEWDKNTPIQEVAARLLRDYQTVRARALTLGLPPRNASLTRLIRRYGAEQVKSFGTTPDEIVNNVYAGRIAAEEAAKQAANKAKSKWRQDRIDQLRQAIAVGKSREEVIFEARASGLTLRQIGLEFNVTRERIRQICNAVAMERAMQAQFNGGA